MKQIFKMILAILVTGICLCDDRLPREAADAERKYDQAVAKLKASYVKRLEKIMETYTRKGDLDAALKIRAEIEKHRVTESLSWDEIFGKNYSWTSNGENHGNRLILLKDGKGVFADKQITWEEIGKRKVLLLMGDVSHQIRFSKNLKSFSGSSTNSEGKIKGEQVD